jgi:tol-pal system-associated acyl-CoA thioesterase
VHLSPTQKTARQITDGQSSDEAFSIQVQINYEDTDAGGVVYYGNYLGYMERARNAYLREQGFPLRTLSDQHQILFVVTEARLRYLLPARLDDELQITLGIIKAGGAGVEFEHLVLRDKECLVKGEIKLAVLNSVTFKPCRIPKILRPSLSDISTRKLSPAIE